MTWSTLTATDKTTHVAELQHMRIGLLEQARAKRAKKPRKSSKKEHKMTFASKELEELFNASPKEFQDFLRGK